MELACDSQGLCGVCGAQPPDYHLLQCDSCSCFWHMACLRPALVSVPEGRWECPDCDLSSSNKSVGEENELVKRIREIGADPSLDESEKARRRQQLLSGSPGGGLEEEDGFLCMICSNPLNLPVTTPCGHNFCLTCLRKWFTSAGGNKCMKCRAHLDTKFMEQPRINSQLVNLIRLSKSGASKPKPVQLLNDDRPDKAFVTERAKRKGKSNAASGKIFVTVPPEFFGPITAEYDPERGRGVLVGDSWDDRMDCRQWGAHRPHVAGIAGQSDRGAQSVALSGGYIDDEDHGEWFLYTGSGGRDLSGNKRTNSSQSFDQKFTNMNKALAVSCLRGYPVRVVRSHKEKRSSYAPGSGVRYDGVYRVERFWRKAGVQGYLVCRYLFVRCDNEPAPWTSDVSGDRPRPLPYVEEIAHATDVKGPTSPPAWDWKEDEGVWGWTAPPGVRRSVCKSLQKKLTKEFSCGICKKVLQRALSTPCGHNFCELCLVERFAGQADIRERGGPRSLRVQKNVKHCPKCHQDITEFMINPAVNRDMDEMIESLKSSIAKEVEEATKAAPEIPEQVEEDIDGSDLVEDGAEEEAEEGEEEGSEESGADITALKMDLVSAVEKSTAKNSAKVDRKRKGRSTALMRTGKRIKARC